MRKEAVIGLSIIFVVLVVGVSLDIIFNVITGFFLSGIIPGTQIALPSLLVFTASIIALSAMIVHPLRRFLPTSQPVTIDFFRRKFIVYLTYAKSLAHQDIIRVIQK